MSSIPFDFVFEIINAITSSGGGGGGATDQLQFVKTAKIGRLLKNVRILRIGRLLKKFGGKGSNKLMMQFANLGGIFMLFVVFLVIAHLIGCFFYFVSDFDVNAPPPETWLWEAGIHKFQTDDFSMKYITSLYSAMLILLGEQIDPKRFDEKVFCVPIILMGAVLQASLFGKSPYCPRAPPHHSALQTVPRNS